MTLLVSLIPLMVAIALYAAFFKLAALLMRRCKLAWVHSFALASLMVVILIGANIASKIVGSALPAWSFSLFALLIGIALGTGYLGTRVSDSEGRVIGLTGALMLTLLAFGLLISVGLALILVFHVIRGTT